MTTAHIKALDLFAGTGWGVACQRLGIKEAGVEIMPEAVATREANGMETIYCDVWEGLTLTAEQHREQYGSYGLLIASPPCQTFSLAGKGAGRAALDEVLEAIQLHAYKDADALLEFGQKHDMRTALVLTPLAYVWRDRPRLVAMEQVPTVLPVWEACAEVMREWGYEVKVEVLNAEQYGVPQTRKRAILVARRGGSVSLPTPTHSRYYSRTPDKLDLGVQKWVSMAEALRWTGFTAEKVMGRGMVERHGTRPGRESTSPAFAIRASAGGMEPGGFVIKYRDDIRRLTPMEAAAIQTYPTVFRNGNQAHAAKRTLDAPAPTIMFGARSNKVEWIGADVASDPSASGVRVTVDEASALQSYPAVVRTSMGKPKVDERNGSHELDPFNRPAHTLTSKSDQWLIKQADASWDDARKIELDEASTLQAFDPPFIWCGTKTKQFLQIGNAVPPLLAEAILAALIGIRPGR